MSRTLTIPKPKVELPPEPEEDVLVIVRTTACYIRGREVVKGDMVKVSPHKPIDPSLFWAIFQYAYVIEGTEEVVEATVYGGAGWKPHFPFHKQDGEAMFRTFEPYRLTVSSRF